MVPIAPETLKFPVAENSPWLGTPVIGSLLEVVEEEV